MNQLVETVMIVPFLKNIRLLSIADGNYSFGQKTLKVRITPTKSIVVVKANTRATVLVTKTGFIFLGRT